MIWWKRCLWLVVMAVWLPATMHCSLEAAGWMASDCCASACSQDHDDAGLVGGEGDSHPHPEPGSCEVCSTVESGGYHRVPPVLLTKPDLLLLWVAWVETRMTVESDARPESERIEESGPPHPGWRRRERVALPPRAPSHGEVALG